MESPSSRRNRPKSRQSIAHLTTSMGFEYDKENATADLSFMRQHKTPVSDIQRRNLRSKSLGPGGLEALKESADSTAKINPTLHIKSILKPTVPLTPPKAIPSFDETRKRSVGRSTRKSPRNYGEEDLLIDFSTPAASYAVTTITGAENVQDPFSPVKNTAGSGSGATAICADEEREAGPGEGEAEELRKLQKQAIVDQRAARRKSMANRRVSFAPEATLHTWNVIEMVEDSTTSSTSNSTRRQSTVTGAQNPDKTAENLPPVPEFGQGEPPSTPPEQVEEPLVKSSPPHQRDLHQQRHRRRSSGAKAPSDGGSRNDSSPASHYSGSSVAGDSSPIPVEDSVHSSSEDGDMAMSMDDTTGQTVRSAVSSSSTSSSLDERLRRAAAEAGTLGIEYDENGDDLSMELAEGMITNAFQPWVRGHPELPSHDHSALQDQENINQFSPEFKARAGASLAGGPASQVRVVEEEEEEELTQSSIVHKALAEVSTVSPSKGISLHKFLSVPEIEPIEEDQEEEETEGSAMDITVAAGGILLKPSPSKKVSFQELVDLADSKAQEKDETQEVTMDPPVAAGDILSKSPPPSMKLPRQNRFSMTNNEAEEEETQGATMNMTVAAGGILPKPSPSKALAIMADSKAQEVGEVTEATMDMTVAAGDILSKLPSAIKKPFRQNHLGMTNDETEDDETQGATMNMTVAAGGILSKIWVPNQKTSRQDDPNVKNKGNQEQEESQGLTMDMTVAAGSILSKTSLSKHRIPPPGLLSVGDDGAREDDGTRGMTMDMTFAAGAILSEGVSPSKGRRKSVAPLGHRSNAARRRSSGAGSFTENGSMDLTAVDGGIITLPQTPKKDGPKKLKGRKSLHVGAARGLLGKRPAELDLDFDEEDVEITPKRLRAVEREASPVKRVHLPLPPTKNETTGRMTRAKRRSLEEMTANAQNTPTLFKSPQKQSAANTPRATRLRDTPTKPGTALPTPREDRLDDAMEAVNGNNSSSSQHQEVERISLQEFLSMTNIHFMELSTTKRRHTVAPAGLAQRWQGENSSSREACFVAAATTLPLLELYQHATRELKLYISTGRRIIGSIEQETLEEQPALFREYVDARPDVKMVMDNQFRNGKANARLQSKAGWYAWRRQLVDGLRGGLEGVKSGMEVDALSLTRQEAILGDTVPELVKHLGYLEQEARMLQQRAENFESVDHESLKHARNALAALDFEVSQKTTLLGQLQQQVTDKNDALAMAAELKVEFRSQIAEAERVQDECRGWKAEDVRILQQRVQRIEKKTGWTLVTAEHEVEEGDVDFGPALTMRYRDALRLFCYPAVFQRSPPEQDGSRRSRKCTSDSRPSAPISLTYAPVGTDGTLSADITTQQRFFLQLLQGHLHAVAVLPQGSVSAKRLLTLVSEGWNIATRVSEEIRQVEIAGITDVSILSDEKLGAKCMLILPDRCRLDVHFTLTANITTEGGITTNLVVEATAKYGYITTLLTSAKACKIRDALNKQATSRQLGEGGWVTAIRGLEEWVKLQKGHVNKGRPDATRPAAQQPRLAVTAQKKELKRPVPIAEVMEEAAARHQELRRQEEELPIPAAKSPQAAGRRPGALRRSPPPP